MNVEQASFNQIAKVVQVLAKPFQYKLACYVDIDSFISQRVVTAKLGEKLKSFMKMCRPSGRRLGGILCTTKLLGLFWLFVLVGVANATTLERRINRENPRIQSEMAASITIGRPFGKFDSDEDYFSYEDYSQESTVSPPDTDDYGKSHKSSAHFLLQGVMLLTVVLQRIFLNF